MKRTLILFFLIFLFAGCAQTQPEETTIPPTTQPVMEVMAEETVPPTTEPRDPLEVLLEMMPLEYKVGQLFLARCPEENALEDVKQYHLGGYVLFGRDFAGQTREALTNTLGQYQLASSIPMLIAVDEEGGSVCRVSGNAAFRSQKFPSPRNLYASGGMDAVLEAETEKAMLLHNLGINVNLAPVCDISDKLSAFMYSRSLGQSPEITGTFVSETVKISADAQVGSVLKHFPGYGNNQDTHIGIALDDRTLEQLESVDLIPFQMGIDAGVGAIMMSHNIVTALDEELPASLSPAVHAYLRETMDFEGVILTDDLAMGAITEVYGAEDAAILAVLAGNDLLCVTDYAVQYQAVLDAAESDQIPREMLDASVLRILRWKQSLGLLY